jgi:hypothetical protein
MQRGRTNDLYQLREAEGRLSGTVDAAGIGRNIAVSGTWSDGRLILEWETSGDSAISEDGKADYQFRFEGGETADGFRGTASLTGFHLAKGVKVPVADRFPAMLSHLPVESSVPSD